MPKDNAQTIGQVVYHFGVRDAAHTPIISAIATADMYTGAWVSIGPEMKATMVDKHSAKAVGIVDPYLLRQVKEGECFWVHLKPGSISTLSHVWTHRRIPDIAATIPDKEQARQRLEDFANGPLHVSLENMLETIESCRNGGDPLYDHGYESLGEYDGFWDDYVLFTGLTDPNKESKYGFYFFTCGGCS
jgi:hypothetical protein